MKRILAWAGAVVALMATLILVKREAVSKKTLKDGAVMEVSGLQIGATNHYLHGSFLEKALSRLLSTNGFSLGKFKLMPPTKFDIGWSTNEHLTAQFHLLGSSNQEASYLRPIFYRTRRMLIYGDNRFPYVAEVSGEDWGVAGFKKYSDGVFAHIIRESFPRDSAVLHFRLEDRATNTSDEWRELGLLDLPNPKPVKPEHWKVDTDPRFTFPPGTQIEIGEAVVHSAPNPYHDIWKLCADLPVRITERGQVVTNWGMTEAKVTDSVGNNDYFPDSGVVSNSWIVFRNHHPLDPANPWHFKVAFGQKSRFPTTNLYSFTLPLPFKGTITTNFGTCQARLSNDNWDYLRLELLNASPDERLDFISAENEDGWKAEGSGSWGLHEFYRSVNMWRSSENTSIHMKAAKQVHVTIAIHPIHWVEFTVQPRYERGLW